MYECMHAYSDQSELHNDCNIISHVRLALLIEYATKSTSVAMMISTMKTMVPKVLASTVSVSLLILAEF